MKQHRCPFPERTVDVPDGTRWICYGCGTQYVAVTVHVEDLVAVDNASNVDIGWDIPSWTPAVRHD